MRAATWAISLIVALVGMAAWVAAPPTSSAPFQRVIFHGCYDGDTCTVSLPGLPALFSDHIAVRLAGIDAPERKSRCAREAQLAEQARVMVNRILGEAARIDLEDPQRDKYFRIGARVVADGIDVGQVLISSGLAVPYHGGEKVASWCVPSS